MKQPIQKPRGTKDILPEEQKYWRFVENIVTKRCEAFDFGKITVPTFENVALFTRGIGEVTDIVEKEMFEVKRLGLPENQIEEKNRLVLRPEFTGSIMRSYIEKGMQTWPQPVKLYSFGPVFRYDRPQKGRYREFWQFNYEVIGDDQPLTDAIVILLAWQIFTDLGLKDDVIIDINSVGCKLCRPKIKKSLTDYYKKFENALCSNCTRRLILNPLRLLDCKEEQCQKITKGAPHIIDMICKECKNHFKQVLERLDDAEIPYDLNPYLVRGLDYYTRTTFEVRDITDDGRQSSLAGGGRYDNLIEILGGKSTPSIGIAGGIDRIIEKIKEKNVIIPQVAKTEIFIIQIGNNAKSIALKLIVSLGEKGFSVSCAFGKTSLKAQLKSANRAGATIALIIGQREVYDKSIIIKDMKEGIQETVKMDELEKVVFNKLKNKS